MIDGSVDLSRTHSLVPVGTQRPPVLPAKAQEKLASLRHTQIMPHRESGRARRRGRECVPGFQAFPF